MTENACQFCPHSRAEHKDEVNLVALGKMTTPGACTQCECEQFGGEWTLSIEWRRVKRQAVVDAAEAWAAAPRTMLNDHLLEEAVKEYQLTFRKRRNR